MASGAGINNLGELFSLWALPKTALYYGATVIKVLLIGSQTKLKSIT